MRPLTISSFTQARDNQAQRIITDFQELVKEFQNPKIIEDEEPSEANANRLKPLLPAWSPATYRDNARENENVERASCLVFDLDGKEKQGLDPNTLNPPFAYAIHSTTRSGFCQSEKAKLRLVIPLANDVDAATYQRLWKHVVAELGIAEHVDSTRLHPGGIFFAPAIFAAHKDRYVFRANLDLPWLDPTPKRKRPEYEDVASASEKHVALNKAAFTLALNGVDEKEIVEGLMEALRENGRRGSSAPVLDWDAAERTITKAVKAGALEKEANDELNAKVVSINAARQKQSESVIKNIVKKAKNKELGFEEAAKLLAPHKDKINIPEVLEEAWRAIKDGPKFQEFLAQVERGLAAAEQVPAPELEKWKQLLDYDPKGNPKANRYNIAVVLKHHPDLAGVAFSVRTHSVGRPDGFPWSADHVLKSHHGQLAAFWAAGLLGSGDAFSPELALRDLSEAAKGKQYDPFTLWIESLTEEPDDTIYHQLCVDCLRAEPTEYHLLVLRSALIMTLQRQFVPGAKADYMPILEGAQGVGKTTFLRQLFPVSLQTECYATMRGDIEDRGNTNLLGMRVILEVGELDSMRKKEVTAFKQWLTIQEDQVRPLYSNVTENVPRRAVCWGTTNESEYLKDTTGNRRFWPIKIGQVDFGWLTQNRNKLWKTVYRDWLAGVSAVPSQEQAERLFTPEQELRREADVLEELVQPYLESPVDLGKLRQLGITPDDGQVVKGVPMWWSKRQLSLLLGLDETDNMKARRLTTALRKLGWHPVTQRINGTSRKIWKKDGV